MQRKIEDQGNKTMSRMKRVNSVCVWERRRWGRGAVIWSWCSHRGFQFSSSRGHLNWQWQKTMHFLVYEQSAHRGYQEESGRRRAWAHLSHKCNKNTVRILKQWYSESEFRMGWGSKKPRESRDGTWGREKEQEVGSRKIRQAFQ